MAGKGGARKGAGRPRNATKHATTATTLTELCAGFASQAFKNLVVLANGGYERVKLEYELQTVVPDPADLDPEGLPRKPFEALVLSGRKVEYAEPDREANKYLIDRFAGRPRQAVELTGEDGSAIRHAVTIYLPENGRDTSVQKDDGLIE
jgi:hypothetical protein